MLHTLLMFIPRPPLVWRARHLLLAMPIVAAVAVRADAQSVPATLTATPTARTVVDGYVAEAMRANLALAQQTTATQRADAAVREARGRFLPSVGVNARYSEFSGVVNIGDFINPAYSALNQLIGEKRFPTDVNATLPFRQETKLELVQPIFNDALFGAAAAARAQRDLIGATRKGAMRQLAADVQQAWLGVASAGTVVATLEATLPVLDENQRVSERLVQAGQATPDVVLRARAERSDLQQQIADAKRQRDAARRSFNLLRNQNADAPITIIDDSSLTATDTLPRDGALSWAMSHREELQQADGGIRIARAQQRIAGADFLPSVAMSATYGVQGDKYRFNRNSDVAQANLVFSWNLLNGGQDLARREQAKYAHDEATYRRREAERGVELQVENALDAVNTARSALGSANDRLESARRAFTLVERRYAEGLATQVEFLSARASFTAAALNQVLTRYTLASRRVEFERAAALRVLPN